MPHIDVRNGCDDASAKRSNSKSNRISPIAPRTKNPGGST